VQSVRCFVFDLIRHRAYNVDACALTSIQPTLSLIDMIYCTADTKATPTSVQGVGVDFETDMDSASPQRFERIRNRISRFRCDFRSADGYGV
jgi:hypothetical protein